MSRRLLLPIAILVAGLLAFVLMLVTRSEVERVEPEVVAPLVRVVTVTARTIRHEVEAHGTVEPPIESELRSQVAG